MRRTLVLLAIVALGVWSAGPLTPQTPSVNQTLTWVLNRTFNHNTNALMATPWLWAAGPELTAGDILSRAYRAGDYLAIDTGQPIDSGTTSTAIVTNAIAVRSIRYEVTEMGPGSFELHTHNTIWATVGATGATFLLPDASLDSSPGEYHIIIKDTGEGFVTLQPFPGQTVNGITGAPPLTGQGAAYHIRRMSNDFWRVVEMSPLVP